MTTEERLENLEDELARAKRRSCRLLAGVGLVAGAFALAWIVATAANRAQAQGSGVPTAIRANAFVLENENGKGRAVLAIMGEDRPMLTLFDKNDEVRAVLGVTKDGPALFLHNENSKVRVALGVTKDGPSLCLRDENGKDRAMLIMAKGEPALLVFDENGKVRASLSVAKNGSGLNLYGENGKIRANLGVNKNGPGLTLLDENGKIRAELGVSKVGPALNLWDENSRGCAKMGAMQAETPDGKIITYPELSLVLFGSDGKVKWQAP